MRISSAKTESEKFYTGCKGSGYSDKICGPINYPFGETGYLSKDLAVAQKKQHLPVGRSFKIYKTEWI